VSEERGMETLSQQLNLDLSSSRYLWQASRFNNFCSAIAGIALLGYYNGLVGFCDIL
jgi:hypothetical protein